MHGTGDNHHELARKNDWITGFVSAFDDRKRRRRDSNDSKWSNARLSSSWKNESNQKIPRTHYWLPGRRNQRKTRCLLFRSSAFKRRKSCTDWLGSNAFYRSWREFKLARDGAPRSNRRRHQERIDSFLGKQLLFFHQANVSGSAISCCPTGHQTMTNPP